MLQRKKIRTYALQGFTLLELLVALAIFAVIALLAYGGLNTVLSVRWQTTQQATELAHLQRAFSWLKRDIEQLVARPIRDAYGDVQPPLSGLPNQLELTRSGWRNPAQRPRSELQRVAYHLEDGQLWRSHWQVLDRVPNSEVVKVALLAGVETVTFRFLDAELNWQTSWATELTAPLPVAPVNNTAATQANEPSPQRTLRGVEVTLEVENWGRLTRIFAVNLY